MAGMAGFHNALGWAHFRLRGGWKTTMTTTVVYTAIVGGLILMTVRANPKSATQTLQGWTIGLLALQIGALLLVCSSGIRTAIRKDIDSGLIESHRLMPISERTAIAGYLTGPTVQGIAGAAATFLMGMLTATGAGLSLFDWLLANLILAIFAINVWIVTALLSLVTKGAFAAVVLLFTVATVSSGMVLVILPGVTILIGPALGPSIFGIVTRGTTWGVEYMVSICAQVILGGLCYLAAARKYRRPDMPAFGVGLGLMIVLTWILLSVVGILAWAVIQPTFLGRLPSMHPYQITVSTLAAVVVAIVPLASAIQEQRQWRKRKRLSDPALGRRPITPVLVVLFLAGLILLLPMFTMRPQDAIHDNLMLIGLAVLTSLLSIRYLVGILQRVTTKIGIMVTIWLAIIWLGPLLLDLARFGMEGDFDGEVATTISGGSPIGVLVNATGEWSFNLIPGLVAQVLIAAGMAVLFHLTERGKISDKLAT